jgi:UDP-N-acetylglucosamine 4,6-dehydratase/5-epimerase
LSGELNLNGASIFVTGGTGSFGRAFTKYVLENFQPRRLIVFSRDEAKQHDMAQQYGPTKYPFMRYFLGDIRDLERLEMAMRNVDYVVHTAALKNVPVAEYNPFECVNTNVHGSENIIRAAIRCNVKRVLAISTDKAVNPINLYGATKLAAEKLFVAANNLAGETGPRFAIARYGNVIGSRGSVVPVFKKLLAEGATELPITDERMTRFWITLEDGVKFVLSSLGLMEGGEIFVPKLRATRVVDLATALAPSIPQKMVGIRPGEKLHETLLSSDEIRTTYELDDRFVIQPSLSFWHREESSSLGGRPLDQDFRYRSNNEDLLMSVPALSEMLQRATVEPA